MANDHWTLDLGALGMEGAGERLARAILRCQPPYAICVQGKWGSGKTSLMRYAMAALGGEPLALTLSTSKEPHQELAPQLRERWDKLSAGADRLFQEELTGYEENEVQIVPIWFNPWQHQHAELPLVALLQEIRAQFSGLLKAGKRLEKYSRIGIEAGLNVLGELVDVVSVLQGGQRLGVGKAFGSVRAVGEAYDRRNFESLATAQRLNLMFEQAVRRLLKPHTSKRPDGDAAAESDRAHLRRLVIFIDDLDRCSDGPTVQLLEAIKLYLHTRYCIFVVGMDRAAARRAVKRTLAHDREEEAGEYLEKLFQATLQVPVPAEHEAFVRTLLDSCDLDGNQLCKSSLRLLESNPRKIKNFINNLALAWEMLPEKVQEKVCERQQDLLLVVYLASYHPQIYRLLTYDPGLAEELMMVLTGGLHQADPGSSPVYRLFLRRFRHAAEGVSLDVSTADSEALVDELVERLDRHRSDREFIAIWRETFGDIAASEVSGRLRPLLQMEIPPLAPPAGASTDG